MAQLHIPNGQIANDPNPANDLDDRTAWGYVESNFSDLYSTRSKTISVGDKRFDGAATTEARVSMARAQATIELAKLVVVGLEYLPFDANLVDWSDTSVRNVYEGGDFSVYDVRAYGADPLGVQESLYSFRAAAAAADANGGVFAIPAGAFKVSGKVNLAATGIESYARVSVRAAGRGATFIRPSVSPWLEIGTAGVGTRGVTIRDLTVQLTSDLFWGAGCIRFVRCTEISCQNVGLLSGTNLITDLYNYGAYLFEFDSSFVAHLDRCDAIGRGVYLFDVHTESVPTLQVDTYTFTNCLSEGMALGVVKSVTSGDIHNLKFNTCKHLMVVSWPEANVSVETTLTSSPAQGATTFTVASGTGLANGQFMWVGQHLTPELVKIATIAGTNVTTANPLRYAHVSGDQVLSGGFMASFGNGVYSVEFDVPHAEFSAAVALVYGTKHVTVTDAYGTPRDIVRLIGAGSSTKGIRVVRGGVAGNGGVNNVVRITAAGDDAALAPIFIDGPVLNPNTGNPPTNLIQNDAATNRAYRYTQTLSSGVAVTVANQGIASSVVLYESVTAAGNTLYDRDFAGTQYAQRRTFKKLDLTDQATVAVDASAGDYQRLLAGGSRTIAAPTNPPANGRSQHLTIVIYNNTGGAITTTWNAVYLMAGAWVDPATTKRRSITFGWDWTSSKWVEESRSAADA